MVRWEPGTRDRLQAAALQLYLDNGFEQTTVTEIAESVGVTERTFFRHFADKREVLFDGQDVLRVRFLAGAATAPATATAYEVVCAALDEAASFFPDERRTWSRRRQRVIDANPALQERELLKLSHLAGALAVALRERGIDDPTAAIAAESAVSIFGSAFARWVAADSNRTFAELQRDGLAALRAFAA